MVNNNRNIATHSRCCSFLANYYLKRRRLEEAYYNAQKCTEFNETREMGKSLLKQIAHFRSLETTTNNDDDDDDGDTTSPDGNVSTSMAGNDSVSMANETTRADTDATREGARWGFHTYFVNKWIYKN